MRLVLRDFRCHRRLDLVLGSGPVVLVGANGSGKTSLLEALSLLAPGRGLRRARLADILRRDDRGTAAAWSVSARIERSGGAIDVVSGFAASEQPGGRDRRQISIDGQPARSREVLADAIPLLWLTPEMDRLFGDSPGTRRRFLDRLVWGLDPAHASRVAAYERAQQQRTAVLRTPAADPAWLDALEGMMASHGIAIAAARRQTTQRLSAFAAEVDTDFPRAHLETDGTVDGWLEAEPALACEDRLRVALAASRRLDTEAGGAAIGPQRSDLQVRLGATGRPAAACSTGEQKMLLIGIVLAAAKLQKQERGTAPLMLLDEVVAHLDDRHRHAMFAAIAELDSQAWFAGTDRMPFQALEGRSQVVELSGTRGGAAADMAMRAHAAEDDEAGQEPTDD
jgi:DNA replication and repair protein RecF